MLRRGLGEDIQNGHLTVALKRRPGPGHLLPLHPAPPPHPPALRTLMKQRWVRSPDEHTRCLHPFLATWEEKEWGWGLSQAGVTEACGRRS